MHRRSAWFSGRSARFTSSAGRVRPGTIQKGVSIAARASALFRVARATRPDVALSHGSYAQVLAARGAGVPAVTMMDYEFQPANHLSFRIANRVVVPMIFPDAALRRFGAREHKVIRYEGFKEELYLGNFRPNDAVLSELGLDRSHVIAVMRPPPEGALYHRVARRAHPRASPPRPRSSHGRQAEGARTHEADGGDFERSNRGR